MRSWEVNEVIVVTEEKVPERRHYGSTDDSNIPKSPGGTALWQREIGGSREVEKKYIRRVEELK